MNLRRSALRPAVLLVVSIFLCLILARATSAQTAPKIVSVTPALDSTNAAPHDSLVIVFDQEMAATPLMLSVPPFVIGNFQFTPTSLNTSMNPSWSTDHKTLTFKPSIGLALNTAVTWTLNPAGATVPITSAAGQPLATVTGNYKIASNSGGNPAETCPPASPAPGAYVFTKSIVYNQTSATIVVPQAVNGALASAQVSSPSDGPVVTNASLTFPGGATKKLTLSANIFRLTEFFTNETALNTSYPAGSYTLHFSQTNESTEHVITFNLPTTPDTIPMIQNYAEAQVIDANKDFTLHWNAFSPLPAGAIVRLVIVDEFANRIFLAPNPCIPRTLDPSATSIVIPAGYLRAGFSYNANLVFTENYYNSTTDVAKMTGNGFVQRTTSFTIKAVNGSVPLPETCDPGTSGLGSYSISKIIAHTQTAADTVILRTNNPAMFNASVQSPPGGPAVTNGSLTLPSSVQTPLANLSGFYILSGSYNTEAELETVYPSGGYTMHFNQTGQPERVIPETMPPTPSVIPKILNYDAAQNIDPTKDFVLQWNAFSPLPAGAFITIVITDDQGGLVYLAPNICLNRTLDPSATSISIPTNYFALGKKYNGEIIFGSTFYYSTTDVAQMVGSGLLERMTSFTLQTGSSGTVTIDPARFTGYRLLPNGHPELDLTGTPNKPYTIIRTGDINSLIWNNLPAVTTSAGGTATFEDTDPTLTLPAYYRAVGN